MEEKLSVFPRGETLSEAAAKNFVGLAYAKNLLNSEILVTNVTFEPGCRNNWHIHHKTGQILLVTGGEGWYQEEGAPAQKLLPGDVVHIPEGKKHWHGATKDSCFAHLALKPEVEGSYCEWLEPVADYEKI